MVEKPLIWTIDNDYYERLTHNTNELMKLTKDYNRLVLQHESLKKEYNRLKDSVYSNSKLQN